LWRAAWYRFNAPGQALDVTGTVRTTGFAMSGFSPSTGYVLTASDNSGNVTWSAPGSVAAGGWTPSGNNVYETNGGNVGIGTTLLTTAALSVMNGNVGIGTWVPTQIFQVGSNTSGYGFQVNSLGNIASIGGDNGSNYYEYTNISSCRRQSSHFS